MVTPWEDTVKLYAFFSSLASLSRLFRLKVGLRFVLNLND